MSQHIFALPHICRQPNLVLVARVILLSLQLKLKIKIAAFPVQAIVCLVVRTFGYGVSSNCFSYFEYWVSRKHLRTYRSKAVWCQCTQI